MAIPIKATLKLSSKAFNLGMKAANKAVGGLVFALKALALAIPVVTGLFTALIARQSALIDRVGKVSQTTGIAVGTLQKFGFAAELAGVSTEQAQVALRRFSRRLGEAQKGTGELLPALKKLGIETRNSDGTFKSAEQVLVEFADGIANTEGASAKLALAFKAFDSEGAELVAVLDEGSAAMLKMFGRAEALGAVLSRGAIQGVEDFNDSFKELQTVLNGVASQLTAALAPALKLVTDELVNFILKGSEEFGSFENLAQIMAVGIVDAIRTVIISFAKLQEAVVIFFNDFRFYARQMGFGELTESAQIFQDELDSINEGLNNISGGKPLDRLRKQIVEIVRGLEVLQAGSDNDFTMILPSDLQKLKENILAIVKVYDQVADSGETNAFRQKKAIQEVNDLVKESITIIRNGLEAGVFDADKLQANLGWLEESLAILGRMKLEIMKKTSAQGDDNDEVQKELSLYEKILETLNQINGKKIVDDNFVDKLKARLDPVERLAKTLEDGLVGAVNKFEDALAQGLIDGKADFAAFGDFIKQTLAKAFVQKFITGPILAAFGLGGLASGGPAKAGRPYIVGEEGPELFIPKNSGTVVPNDETMDIMGAGGPGMRGGGATYITNISAVDTQSFQTAIARDPEFIFNVSRAGARRTPGG
jgi:hypothetical protein